MTKSFAPAGFMFSLLGVFSLGAAQVPYPVVDTGQRTCFNDSLQIPPPAVGDVYFGQDAQYAGLQPAYADNGDGTVSDLNTGLMWVQARGSKMTWAAAKSGAATCTAGGHTDWRMPTIKELYSLIDFNGFVGGSAATSVPYLDDTYFAFAYGDTAIGERLIDCQDWSATPYVGLTMNNDTTIFGVNFADGRIKGYPRYMPPAGSPNRLYVRYVRGNPAYGQNAFQDNGDSTITDDATGLIWTKADSRLPMNWRTALGWVQEKNAANYLGHNDWRLPNAKELQTIVDYTRAPAVTGSPAVNPVFLCSAIGANEYPFYWTNTTHIDGPPNDRYRQAVYVCFGRALGWMQFPPLFTWQLVDVHGAGAQRSDPKSGDTAAYPHGRGPQGDVVRIYNHVRLVRGGGVTLYGDRLQFGVSDGWNLVSVPLRVPDYRHTSVFPSSISSAFRFDQEGGYLGADTLVNGSGYWVKFGNSQTLTMPGLLTAVETLTVRSGWNLIGTVSHPVVRDSILQIPPGIVLSDFYAYSGSYAAAETLKSGQGYWVKVGGEGRLVLR